ncbi:MAG: DUF167 domain-containing protein [bacterium]|nr:DUF167 domain-containing protein [bacterium]
MQNIDDLKITKTNDGVSFRVKVVPNSSASKVVEANEEFVKIKLNSPPIEGRANKEVIELLSKVLDVPKTSIELVSGDKSKLKTLKVPLSEEQVREKILEALS